MSIKQNMKDNELYALILDEEPGSRFWELCLMRAKSLKITLHTDDNSPTSMTENEAAIFGLQSLPLGKYNDGDFCIEDVFKHDVIYLDWLAGFAPFYKDLNRYLITKRLVTDHG